MRSGSGTRKIGFSLEFLDFQLPNYITIDGFGYKKVGFSPGFRVFGPPNPSLTTGQYITDYNGFLTNYGNSFSASTGVFTAPRDGIYEFFSATNNIRNTESNLGVMKNNYVQELEFFTDNDYQDPLSVSWMMDLEKGDTIRLKVTDSNDGGFNCTPDANCISNGKFISKHY